MGWDYVIGVASRYGLHGLGNESLREWDFPQLYNWNFQIPYTYKEIWYAADLVHT